MGRRNLRPSCFRCRSSVARMSSRDRTSTRSPLLRPPVSFSGTPAANVTVLLLAPAHAAAVRLGLGSYRASQQREHSTPEARGPRAEVADTLVHGSQWGQGVVQPAQLTDLEGRLPCIGAQILASAGRRGPELNLNLIGISSGALQLPFLRPAAAASRRCQLNFHYRTFSVCLDAQDHPRMLVTAGRRRRSAGSASRRNRGPYRAEARHPRPGV